MDPWPVRVRDAGCSEDIGVYSTSSVLFVVVSGSNSSLEEGPAILLTRDFW
jgi:hypothetical protein